MKRKIYISNSSGCPGVSFDHRANKWRAYISFNGKKIRLGNFSNIDDAISTRRFAEISYSFNDDVSGDWALLSFIGDTSFSARFKLIILLLSDLHAVDIFSLSCVRFCDVGEREFVDDGGHSFPIFVIRNWHIFEVSCDVNSLFIFLNFCDKLAPKEFFLYLNGFSFSRIFEVLGVPRSSSRRNILNFAQKLKNKFSSLL